MSDWWPARFPECHNRCTSAWSPYYFYPAKLHDNVHACSFLLQEYLWSLAERLMAGEVPKCHRPSLPTPCIICTSVPDLHCRSHLCTVCTTTTSIPAAREVCRSLHCRGKLHSDWWLTRSPHVTEAHPISQPHGPCTSHPTPPTLTFSLLIDGRRGRIRMRRVLCRWWERLPCS